MPLVIPTRDDVKTGRYPFIERPKQQKFIEALLKKDPNERLGCGPGGFLGEIKTHPWMEDISWDKLYMKQLSPDFIPDVLIYLFSHLKTISTLELHWKNCCTRVLL
jgi:hypothetical protein